MNPLYENDALPASGALELLSASGVSIDLCSGFADAGEWIQKVVYSCCHLLA